MKRRTYTISPVPLPRMPERDTATTKGEIEAERTDTSRICTVLTVIRYRKRLSTRTDKQSETWTERRCKNTNKSIN
jgi:hypothetical protein